MKPVLVIAAYRFVQLADPHAWRVRVAAAVGEAGLMGTVLLAMEGINLVLAGAPPAVRGFVSWLGEQDPFAGLAVAESGSDRVPFARLRVKVKAEIIRMNRPAVQPAERRAAAVGPDTLVRWLDAGHDDAGRPLVLLDTRNAFEVRHGRFRGSRHWNLGKFTDFPAALDAHRSELAGRTVVTYCTGGIRCEKAALLMTSAGVGNVLQLDGGILGYFERVGGAHFDGACFVFDERVGLDSALDPSAHSAFQHTSGSTSPASAPRDRLAPDPGPMPANGNLGR